MCFEFNRNISLFYSKSYLFSNSLYIIQRRYFTLDCFVLNIINVFENIIGKIFLIIV